MPRRGSKLTHRFLSIATALFVVLTVFTVQTPTTAHVRYGQNASLRLESNKPIQASISRGESHSYTIQSPGDVFIELSVIQRGIDVVVSLFGPDGGRLLEVDRTEAYGPEIVMGVISTPGQYRIQVAPVDEGALTGKYEILLKQLRTAREDDKVRINSMSAAFDAAAEGDELRAKSDRSSLKLALEKYEAALEAWRRLGDKHWEASTLQDVGSVYQLLGQNDKALAMYDQSLTIFKSLENPSEQALTLGLMAKLLDTPSSSTAERRKALDYRTRALPLFREIRDRPHEVLTLNYIGLIHGDLGDHQTSLKYFDEALPLAKTLPDRNLEATTLYNTGRAYSFLSENQKALDLFGQALPIFKRASNSDGESRVLHNMGSVYHALGEIPAALDLYNQSLRIDRANGDKLGEGANLNDIGGVYSDIGEQQRALEFYNQALPIRRQAGDHVGEASTLNNIAGAYDSLGQMPTALDSYNKALIICREAGDRDCEATTLNNLGFLFGQLGDTEKAIEFYNKALELFRAVSDHSGEATTLNNLGRAYDDLLQRRKAVDFFTKAWTLQRTIGDRGGEAVTLNNLGNILYDLGEKQEALEYFNQAVALDEAIGDLSGQATALNGVAMISSELGKKQLALTAYDTAILSQRLVGDRSGEAETMLNLAFEWKGAGKPLLALFYGKEAINLLQSLRSIIQSFNKEQQRSYLNKVEPSYRFVADLLFAQGRLAEAHQTLNLFKDQQFFDFNRTSENKPLPLTLTAREAASEGTYEESTTRLAEIFQKQRKLKLNLGVEKAKQLPEYQELDKQLRTTSKEFIAFQKNLEAKFAQADPQGDQTEEISDTRELQRSLSDLKAQTKQSPVAVYTLVGDESFHALVITPENIFATSQPVKGEALNQKAKELWGLLQSDKYDPSSLSQQLYTIVFKPIEAQLPKDTTTILWMLDGNLRYVPMGALYDGKQYLIERYNQVVFTRPDRERLLRDVSPRWTGLGLGSSQAQSVELLGDKISFNPLPGVTEELRVLFRQNGSQSGIIDGEVLSDVKFTKTAMLNALKQKPPLVHISSHFSFRPGDEARSFLLLGDGTAMTLAEMKQQPDLFSGVELLTLSACNTAAQQPGANGREIDGFAELAQRLGAGSVMATLWPVADNSTPWLMRQFYQSRQSGKGMSKAEAFRQAQLALLKGTAQTKPLPAAQKGSAASIAVVITGNDNKRDGSRTSAQLIYIAAEDAPVFKPDPSKPFSHPYYWAPFILIGNWK